MRILAINCGSSSIKSALIETTDRRRMLAVQVENLGTRDCTLHVGDDAQPVALDPHLEVALRRVLAEYQRAGEAPHALVHRVVHGGSKFTEAVVIEAATVQQLDALTALAPLHNPPAMLAIRLARELWPGLPHVAVFDTAFHATLPEPARDYALPIELRNGAGIRRFGFHGISHAHVMTHVAGHLQREPRELRIISCHLGNGASMTAIERGRSVDTSMGMTPLEGLVMGTRGGDIDPGALLHVLQSGKLTIEALADQLQRHSGLLGLTGTNDMRQIEARAAVGATECRAALALYAYRIRKYVGAYAAVMGGVDAIAFTGGIGEHSAQIRALSLQRLEFLGAILDAAANQTASVSESTSCAVISTADSPTTLLVVRADEELAMVLDAARCLGSGRG
jgi:acetate kinase